MNDSISRFQLHEYRHGKLITFNYDTLIEAVQSTVSSQDNGDSYPSSITYGEKTIYTADDMRAMFIAYDYEGDGNTPTPEWQAWLNRAALDEAEIKKAAQS